MNKKWGLSYHIVNTEDEAKAFCDRINAELPPYARKRYPAHYTPWSSGAWSHGQEETGFIAWYRTKSGYAAI